MALEPLEYESTSCPGCWQTTDVDDLCSCDDTSGPMCDRCCRVAHHVGTAHTNSKAAS